jgi:hypothetical protein
LPHSRLLRTFLHVFRGHEKRLFYVVFGCNGGVEGLFLGDNVSVRHDSPVCSVVFLTKQLCTQVRLLRIFWGEGSFDVGVRVRHVEGEVKALFPTFYPFFLVFRKCRC